MTRITKYFNKYIDQVHNEQDRVLFVEAIESANRKIYRSAYILTWLSCVESLKRKFREAGKTDNKANNLYSQIIHSEKQHNAVDLSVIERAKNYGFINDIEHTKLKQIYEMRCIYAHPYEEAPNKIAIEKEISDIVDIVLSKPTLLCENFIDELISKLTSDKNYLHDYEQTVTSEAEKWVKKINPNYYNYFIKTYWEKTEQLSSDPNLNIFKKRAVWILKVLLRINGCEIFSNAEWHDFVAQYPVLSIDILVDNEFFMQIGERAQDYLINKILELANINPAYLNVLIPFLNKPEVLRENLKRINDYIENLNVLALNSSDLELNIMLNKLIDFLSSGTFDLQKMAINIIKSRNDEILNLTTKQQIKLGMSIHFAAYWGEWTTKEYFDKLICDPNIYPPSLLEGICGFLFFRDEAELDYKIGRLGHINILLGNLNDIRKDEIIKKLEAHMSKVDTNKRNYENELYDITHHTKLAESYWANEIINIAKKMYDEIEKEDE